MELLPLEVKDWSIEDVSHWLKKNNFEKIVDSFRNSEIKGNSLLKIDKKYFSELGIMDILTMKEGNNLLELIEKLNLNEKGPSFNFNLKDYEFDTEIGSGSFGKVYKVTKKSNKNEIKAIKKIIKTNDKEYKNRIEIEKNILKSIDHPNVIKIYGYCEDKNFVYFLMEYIPNSIKDYYTKNQFSIDQIRIITKSLLKGLEYIHKNGFIHRDLKCQNILIDKNFQTKIIDFGLSCIIDDSKGSTFETLVGTAEFLAPELYFEKTNQYGRSCDIWSLGCVVLEMYYRGKFWNGEDPFKMKTHPTIPKEIPYSLKDFLTCCFHIQPSFRPTAELLLTHQWILNEPELIDKTEPSEKILLSEYQKYGGNYYNNRGFYMSLPNYSYDEYVRFRDIDNLPKQQNDISENDNIMINSLIEDLVFLKIGSYTISLTKDIKSKTDILITLFLNSAWRGYQKKAKPGLSDFQAFVLGSNEILIAFSYYLVFKYSHRFYKTNICYEIHDFNKSFKKLEGYFIKYTSKNVMEEYQISMD